VPLLASVSWNAAFMLYVRKMLKETIIKFMHQSERGSHETPPLTSPLYIQIKISLLLIKIEILDAYVYTARRDET